MAHARLKRRKRRSTEERRAAVALALLGTFCLACMVTLLSQPSFEERAAYGDGARTGAALDAGRGDAPDAAGLLPEAVEKAARPLAGGVEEAGPGRGEDGSEQKDGEEVPGRESRKVLRLR
jgi:hypothetical protein